MPNDRRPATTTAAEHSINAILDAEQRSREQLAQRRAEAAQLLVDARAQARRILERADARGTAVHNAAQRQAAARTAELRDDTEAVRSRPVQADAHEAELRQAIARLAGELTGD